MVFLVLLLSVVSRPIVLWTEFPLRHGSCFTSCEEYRQCTFFRLNHNCSLIGQSCIHYPLVSIMRFQIRGWFLLCVTVALAAGHVVRIWSPATGTLLTEPRWVFEESSREENELALALLCGPAPEIGSKVSVRELSRKLQYDYRVTMGPDAIDYLESLENEDFRGRFRGQKLGDWLVDTLKPLQPDLIVQRGQIQIMEQKRSHDDDKPMLRIYPCPRVSSDSLIQSIESNCGYSNWMDQGGQDSILVLDNDLQSLLVISTDYLTHQKVEALLKYLYRTCGIGWRNEAPGIIQLPTVLARRLALWLEPPKTPNTPSNSFGCVF